LFRELIAKNWRDIDPHLGLTCALVKQRKFGDAYNEAKQALLLDERSSRAFTTAAPTAAQKRDGQHDFDFEIGTWKTHLRRLLHPLTGSTTWVEYEGTTVVRKVWNGRANLVELEVDGPAGHLEGLSLRLYNPESHQWSLNFANSHGGTMSQPTIGEFIDGRGECFDQ